MTLWFQAILIFAFSVGNDWISILWHECRLENKPFWGAVWAVSLGLIGWLSFIWVLSSSHWLMVPDLIGTAIGSYYGIKQYHARKEDEEAGTYFIRWESIKVTPAGILLRTLHVT